MSRPRRGRGVALRFALHPTHLLPAPQADSSKSRTPHRPCSRGISSTRARTRCPAGASPKVIAGAPHPAACWHPAAPCDVHTTHVYPRKPLQETRHAASPVCWQPIAPCYQRIPHMPPRTQNKRTGHADTDDLPLCCLFERAPGGRLLPTGDIDFGSYQPKPCAMDEVRALFQASGDIFRVVFFLISLGSPRVLRAHMGHTCGEPNEIELTAARGIVLPLPFRCAPRRGTTSLTSAVARSGAAIEKKKCGG